MSSQFYTQRHTGRVSEYNDNAVHESRRLKKAKDESEAISRHPGAWSPSTARSFPRSPRSPPPDPMIPLNQTPDLRSEVDNKPMPPPPSEPYSSWDLQPPPSPPPMYAALQIDSNHGCFEDKKPFVAQSSARSRFEETGPNGEEKDSESSDASDDDRRDRRPKAVRPEASRPKRLQPFAYGTLQRQIERVLLSDTDIKEYHKHGFDFQCIVCDQSLFPKDLSKHVRTNRHQELKRRKLLDTARVRQGKGHERKETPRKGKKGRNSGRMELSGLYEGALEFNEAPVVKKERMDVLGMNCVVKRAGVYDCELCAITFANENAIFAELEAKAHVETEDHKMRREAYDQNKPLEPTNVDEIPSESYIEKLKPKMIKQLSGPKFKCICCDAILLGKSTIDVHVASGYHMAKQSARASGSDENDRLNFELKQFWSNVNSAASVQMRLDRMIANAKQIIENDPRHLPELQQFLGRLETVRRLCGNKKTAPPMPFMK